MEAGLRLDALIAEKIMGLPGDVNKGGELLADFIKGHWQTNGYPKYSTSISAAWDVVEKMDCISIRIDKSKKGSVLCWLDCTYEGEGLTAPHAICLAALKAKRIEI